MKNAITKLSENDMELDGWIDGAGDEDTVDGEAGRIGKKMVRTTRPHSLLFPYMLFFAEIYVSVVFAIMCVARVWGYFHPPPLGMI